MFTAKIRSTLLTVAVAGSIAATAVAPAVSSAQYNNFGFLKSSANMKLKTQGNKMPCQPTNPVENPGVPSPIGPVGSPPTRGGAQLTKSAQQETRSTVGPLQEQTCEADEGIEVAY